MKTTLKRIAQNAIGKYRRSRDLRRVANIEPRLARAINNCRTNTFTASEKRDLRTIEERRRIMLKDKTSITIVDLGAGNEGTVQYPVSHICNCSKSKPWAELLFHLARQMHPLVVLELGTCVGVSGSYIASALRLNGEGKLFTIEGDPETAKIAGRTFSALNLSSWVDLLIGPLAQMLGPTLEKVGQIDMAFIDANHYGEATLEYYERMKPFLNNGALLAFDDITWSQDMYQAWEKLTKDASLHSHLQLGNMGFAVFSK